MSRTVVVVQPYIPAYRRPFFLALLDQLRSADIDLVVAAGRPAGQQAARRDEVDLPNLVHLPERQISFRGRSLSFRHVGDVIAGADLVVLEQARRNLETYQLLLGPRRGRRVALWGHGRTVSRGAFRWEHILLDWLTRRADWLFAYTDAGAEYVISNGFPRDRCTVVHNSTDTVSLRDAIETVPRKRVDAFRRDHDLTTSSVAFFVGGLDASKRIDFLLEAVRRIAAEVPAFRLLIAGRGVDESKIVAAQQTGLPVIHLGDCRGDDLAVAARASEMILMPGRVGLIAVDSFAMGLPVITTDWPYHAPELSYLKPGWDSMIVPDQISEFVGVVTQLLSNPGRLHVLQSNASARAVEFGVERMAQAFATGIQTCLDG